MPSVPLLPNPHGRPPVLRHYVQSSPHLFDRSSIAKQNLSHRANVICDGSPSRIRMVRRISLGMTTRPRSSIRRTIPVAFIYEIPPVKANFTSVVSAPREMNMHEVPLTIFCRQSTARRIAVIKKTSGRTTGGLAHFVDCAAVYSFSKRAPYDSPKMPKIDRI